MNRAIIFTAAIASLSACAPRPDAIAPISMPTGMYMHLSCDAARTEYATTTEALIALEKKQRGAATGDAIGVVLLGVPASSLAGGDKSGQIAAEKGRKIALEDRLNRCN